MDFLIALIEIFYPGAIDLASKTKKRRVRRLFTGVGSIFIVVAAVFLFLSFLSVSAGSVFAHILTTHYWCVRWSFFILVYLY